VCSSDLVAVALIGYNLAAGQWKAEAKVLSAEGQEVRSGGLRLLAADPGAAGGAARAEGSFKTPDLPPGEYWLQVTLTDANGGSGTSVSPFTVTGS
jgi:hypothetical protein